MEQKATFKKGYVDDIGIDICLPYNVVFEPFETKIIDIGVSLPTYNRQAIMMCARTSAAKKGIIVNQCPIDPNYTGNAHIIATNCSFKRVEFEPNQAFAQIYAFDIQKIDVPFEIKQEGKRENFAFGSSDWRDKIDNNS